MVKRTIFILMMTGCAKHGSVESANFGGLSGYAGQNFSSTNSPCLDGVIAAVDHSCAVPMEIEEEYPYITIQCQKVREGASPWNKYNIIAITNAAIEDPQKAAMMCVDPHTRIFIQKRP
jgi:hypothetical protein